MKTYQEILERLNFCKDEIKRLSEIDSNRFGNWKEPIHTEDREELKKEIRVLNWVLEKA